MLKKILKSYDYSLIFVIILLAVFGLIMIYSASMVNAIQRYGYESDHFYDKQKIILVIGAILFVFFAILPYKIMLHNKVLAAIVILSSILLFCIFPFGHEVNNAKSWYRIGGFSLQPAELAKVSVIVYLASTYSKKQSYINDFNRGVLPPLVFIALTCIMIAAQPDYGTAGIIVLGSLAVILSSGMNLKNLTKLFVLGTMIVGALAALFGREVFSSVRVGRLTSYMNPFAEEIVQKEGYNMVNSFLAIGAGGLKGLGLGQSIQKLGYLPEPHTDFIMAVIAEELGILGVLFVIGSLAFIILKGFYIAAKGKDPFGSLLAIGFSSMLGVQSFVNLAGVSGVIPLTGVPLPFISYGGSSIFQLAISMGILVNVSMFVNYERKYKSEVTQTKTKPSVQGNVYSLRK